MPSSIIDAGFASAEEVLAAGIDIGTPVVYAPKVLELAGGRIAGTSVDDRAGCAVVVEVARALLQAKRSRPMHLVFSVQEEFNLRGAVTAARRLAPDIAIQLDLILATDTPDMAARGDVRLGGGPAMSLYSFHGRGTLNGTIPHPALVSLFSTTAVQAETDAAAERPYRRAHRFLLCAAGPCRRRRDRSRLSLRYTHSSLEVCDLADLAGLTRLLVAGIAGIEAGFSLDRDDFTQ